MSNHPVPRRVSRTVAVASAVCLVLPAALNAAFHLITPVTALELPDALAQAAAQPGLAVVAATLPFALPVLGVGVLVLGWRASRGAPRLAAWGTALLAGGYLLGTSSAVGNLLEAVVASHSAPDVALDIVRSFQQGPGRLAVITQVGQGPGLVLMGLALWRSRAVPRVLAGGLLATLPLHVLSHSGEDNVLPAVSWAWLTLVLAGCAAVVIRDAWSPGSTALDSEPWSDTRSGTTMSS